MMQFVGEFQHTLDTKGRIALPALFRKGLSGELVLTIGAGDALCVYTEEEFDMYVSSLFPDGSYNSRNKKHIDMMRLISQRSSNATLDSAGRVNIPAKLLEMAHLDHDVTVMGAFDHIEMWDTKRLENYNASLDSLDDMLFTED